MSRPSKPDAIVRLTCTCCGREHKGQQSHNHDRNFGTCPTCANYQGRGATWGGVK